MSTSDANLLRHIYIENYSVRLILDANNGLESDANRGLCTSANSANHFRTISLCNTIYKIITTRLKIVMGQIIQPLRGAFVLERLIQDNILITTHEFFINLGNNQEKKNG